MRGSPRAQLLLEDAAVPRAPTLAALLVVAAVLFSGLGGPEGGTHPDEGLYLQAAREMHARGDWLTPTVDGGPDFTKPPLLYWAMAGSFSLFGVTLWAARLPVALAALALAWMAGLLARREVGPGAGPIAILLVGTCLGLLRYARVDLMDVPLALAIAVGLWALWRVAAGESPALALAAGVAAAAAALLKGPVGPLLMVLPATVYLARRGVPRARLGWLLAAGALALLLAAPWYLAMAERHGAAFVGRFFGTENVGKFRFPWTLDGRAGPPARAAHPLPALDAARAPARPRGGAGLAVGAGAAPRLLAARAEAPALRGAGAGAAGGAGERTASGSWTVGDGAPAPRPRPRRRAGPAVPARRSGPVRAGGRGAAPRARGRGGGSRRGAGRGGGLRRGVGPPLRGRPARGGAPARPVLGGGAGRAHGRSSPPPRTRASTRSCSAARCTGRPGRTGCSVRSRRGRGCW